MNGVNRVVNALANAQADLGYDVEVWGITADPYSEVPQQKYKVRLFQSVSNKLLLHPSVKAAYKELSNEDAIVHIHGTFIFEFVWIGKLLRKLGQKYCITTHGTFNSRALAKGSQRKKYFFHLFDSKLVRGAAFMHFLGQSEYDAFENKVKNHRKVLIPNGMDLSEIKYDFVSKKKNKEFVFGFCGRMKKNVKGLDLMLEGFSKYLKENNVDDQLWFIGDGDQKQEVERMVLDLQLKENVVFWGSQYGEEKFNLLANMDVFLHTSRYEGMPTAVLEAAALGLPSIVSKETNVGQYLTTYSAGYMTPENTSDEIARAMQFMKSDVQIKKSEYYKNCKKMVEEVFDWKKIAASLYREYDK